MEGNNIQGSLDRLQQILSGRTITDLLSIVDPKQLPQPTTEDAPKMIDLDSNQATLADSKSISVINFLFYFSSRYKIVIFFLYVSAFFMIRV